MSEEAAGSPSAGSGASGEEAEGDVLVVPVEPGVELITESPSSSIDLIDC